MPTTLATVVDALSAAVAAQTYRDAAGVAQAWRRTDGLEAEEALSAADREGHFLIALGEGRETTDTGESGIAVAERRLDVLLFREPTGDSLPAQVLALDDGRAVEHAIEAVTGEGIEFVTVESSMIGVSGDALTVTLRVVVRFRVAYP